MKVSLVSLTQSLAPGQSPEELIVYCARVSSPHRQGDDATGPNLVRYLIKHGHWSPFEMVDMTVEVETSRAIAAQILRHWSFSVQEFSQRYAKAELGFERCKARRQDTKDRQNSTDDLPDNIVTWFDAAQEEVEQVTEGYYTRALEMGIAKEQARMLLPLSTRTRMYLKGAVRDWMHYLKARTAKGAQREHRDVAEAVLPFFAEHFPVTHGAFFGRDG